MAGLFSALHSTDVLQPHGRRRAASDTLKGISEHISKLLTASLEKQTNARLCLTVLHIRVYHAAPSQLLHSHRNIISHKKRRVRLVNTKTWNTFTVGVLKARHWRSRGKVTLCIFAWMCDWHLWGQALQHSHQKLTALIWKCLHEWEQGEEGASRKDHSHVYPLSCILLCRLLTNMVANISRCEIPFFAWRWRSRALFYLLIGSPPPHLSVTWRRRPGTFPWWLFGV